MAPYIDSEGYPKVTFRSQQISLIGHNRFELLGILEMNGIQKEMVFDATFNGFAYPGEKLICGFDVVGHLDRNDFKVGTDDELHSGRKIHDDTISLQMSLRME